jgi:hypothetical protein
MKRALLVVAVNLAIIVFSLSAVEAYFRFFAGPDPNDTMKADWPNGIWLQFQPYVMYTNTLSASHWQNTFTGKTYPTTIKTNSAGFSDPHEFSLTEPYEKAPNERVVLLTGGSVAWGVGSTATGTAIAGRMQHYLNSRQSTVKYTVINLAMGAWIAYQELIGLELWGTRFHPDWVVVMDGYNDAAAGCGYSQGVANPMYYALIKSYIEAYLMTTVRPVFYRGWLENELIRLSAAYRRVSGKDYVPYLVQTDETSHEGHTIKRAILPTKVGEARAMLDFYLKAQVAMLKLFPDAHYILSTQPIANEISKDFGDIYDYPAGSDAERAAVAKREGEIDDYLSQYAEQLCGQATYHPAYVYILVNGAIRLARLADEERGRGRAVEYANIGRLFPKEYNDRLPYFIDSAHVTDDGADLIGRFYAEQILQKTDARDVEVREPRIALTETRALLQVARDHEAALGRNLVARTAELREHRTALTETRALLQEARDHETALDRNLVARTADVREYMIALAETEALLQAARDHEAALDRYLVARTAEVREQMIALTETKARLQEARAQGAALDRDLVADVARLDGELGATRRRLAEQESELRAIERSLSWRATAPLRRLLHLLRRGVATVWRGPT